MTVTFWGVRGSTPAPGYDFARYGGHTTCVSVAVDGAVLVLDAGTGIRPLGQALAGEPDEVFLLLTHLHADHLLGFPFFAPLYGRNHPVHLFDFPFDGGLGTYTPLMQFDGLHYPLRPSDIPAAVERLPEDALDTLQRFDLHVERQPLNHPGGAFGYRITHRGHSFVFIPDNELDAPEPVVPYKDIVAFCRGADVLCHDAQYRAAEILARRGWGHSAVEEVGALAAEAGVGHLLLFHHDPERTDAELGQIETEAQAALAEHGVRCTVAYEGLSLGLGEAPRRLSPDPAVAPKAESA